MCSIIKSKVIMLVLKGELVFMDKRYQVFVSSTFEDLQEERKIVIQALLENDCIPAGMELFPASNEEQWSFIKDVINDCDYYLLIIGGRYGSTNDDGISYTQMEYEYAKQIGKPIIAFLHKKPENIVSGKTEQTEKGKQALKDFCSSVKGHLVQYWENPNELASAVITSIHRLIKRFPAEGWVKANSVVDQASLLEIRELKAENRKLQSELAAIKLNGPEGTEKLSQGDETIDITVSANLDAYQSRRETVVFSWNRIFVAIGPSMIDDSPEIYIKHLLEQAITKEINNHLSPTTKKYIRCDIGQDIWGVILVQLKALGLMKLSTKKRSGGHDTYWSLTPYGDMLLTRLVAIPKAE